MADAIAEHSMCHPGRPRTNESVTKKLPFPQGLGQKGSPAFEDFHRAKSLGLRFCYKCSNKVNIIGVLLVFRL